MAIGRSCENQCCRTTVTTRLAGDEVALQLSVEAPGRQGQLRAIRESKNRPMLPTPLVMTSHALPTMFAASEGEVKMA